MAINNEFSWSKSRDEQFQECQRKYYYDKYVSWGGWDRRMASKEARAAYVLKNLKNRWAWKGETVHHVLEGVLKELKHGKKTSLEDGLEFLTQTMRRDFRFSKAKKYYEEPKKVVGLFEHEYEKAISDEIWKSIHDSSSDCLRHFMNSPFFQELVSEDKSDWLLIEDLEAFDYEGIKIFVKLDFCRKKNGLIEIYDWKTGKDESGAADIQLGTYVFYAMKKWQLSADKIKTYLFYLNTPGTKPELQTVSGALLERAGAYIKQSVMAMTTLLEDVEKNLPKSREFFKLALNDRLCSFCNFYKLCERGAPKFKENDFKLVSAS